MIPLFLSIQGSYQQLELALFSGSTCLETITKGDHKASSHIIPYVGELLCKHKITLNSLAFIAIDKGPGAFTSLRVCIATANGLGFAANIPLIGINGLEALYEETKENNVTTICLLNAYNQDVYFYTKTADQQTLMGCDNINNVLSMFEKEFINQKIFFTGNGSILHQEKIISTFDSKAVIKNSIQESASARQIGIMGHRIWQQQKQPIYKIIPDYLKTQTFAIKK